MFNSEYCLKLADFGMATPLEGMNGDGVLHEKVGTSIYWAPEVRRGKYEGKTSDIFSMGMVLFVMIFGSIPFRSSAHNDDLYQLFRDGDISKNEKYWEIVTKGKNKINPDLKELFQKMFHSDPEKRPTCSELKECKWLKNGSIASQE